MPDRNRQTASNLRKPRLNWPKLFDCRSFRGRAGLLAPGRWRIDGERRASGGRRKEGPGTLAEDRAPSLLRRGVGMALGGLRDGCAIVAGGGGFLANLGTVYAVLGARRRKRAFATWGNAGAGDAGRPPGCVNRREIGQKPRRSPGDCGCVKRVACRLTRPLRRRGERLGGGCGEARRDGWRWSALQAVRVGCGRLLLAAFGRAGRLAGAGRRWRPVCAGW